MSTNSRIGLRLADGSILSVYHHWDGYPQWLGVTLNQQYPTREDVAELIDGGNMSCCYTQSGWEIEDEDKVENVTIQTSILHRGESMEENAPRLHKTTSHFFEDTNKCCGEFAYIKELDGTLECYVYHTGMKRLKTSMTYSHLSNKTIPSRLSTGVDGMIYPNDLKTTLFSEIAEILEEADNSKTNMI